MHMFFLMILSIPKIAGGYDLALEKIDGHSIVWDIETGPLCYPFEDNEQSGRHRPMSHHDWGFGVKETETLITKAAKVMCRQLGFTHLNRAYKVNPQTIGSPYNETEEIKGTSWNASCFGFEPLLRHCVINEFMTADCSYLLAIDCGICYEKKVLKLGETEVIKSPGFPEKVLYPDDSFCQWYFEAESRSIFLATFSHFSLPSPDDNGICSRGALSFEGYDSLNISTSIMPFCGNKKVEPFSLVAKTLVIRFTSGLYYPRPFQPGFTFNITLLEHTVLTGIPVPYEPDVGVITAIVLGAILLISVVALCLMVHRLHNSTKHAKHRILMEERVAIREQTTIRRTGTWNTLPHVSTITEETMSMHSEVTIPPKSLLALPTSQENDGHSSLYVELEAFRKNRKQSEQNSLGTEYMNTPMPTRLYSESADINSKTSQPITSTSVPLPSVHQRTNGQHLNTPKKPLYSTIQKNHLNKHDLEYESPHPPPVPPRSPRSLSPRPTSLPRPTLRRSLGSRTQSPLVNSPSPFAYSQRCSTLKYRPNLSYSLWNVKPIHLPNAAQMSADNKSVSEPSLIVPPQVEFPEGRLKRISQYFSTNWLHSKNNLEDKRQRLSSHSSYKARDIFSAGRRRMRSLASVSSNMNGYNILESSTSNILQIPLQTDDPVLFNQDEQ